MTTIQVLVDDVLDFYRENINWLIFFSFYIRVSPIPSRLR